MALRKSELPQGTLDMLILQVVALGPIHGYAISQRIQQISRDALQVLQGSLYQPCIGWKPGACSQPGGRSQSRAGKRNSTG
jgi:hypothetical protein